MKRKGCMKSAVRIFYLSIKCLVQAISATCSPSISQIQSNLFKLSQIWSDPFTPHSLRCTQPETSLPITYSPTLSNGISTTQENVPAMTSLLSTASALQMHISIAQPSTIGFVSKSSPSPFRCIPMHNTLYNEPPSIAMLIGHTLWLCSQVSRQVIGGIGTISALQTPLAPNQLRLSDQPHPRGGQDVMRIQRGRVLSPKAAAPAAAKAVGV